ncbi:MAG: tetratricopeptide repeat protein [Proteobacteria bacterium]|nr:tetratricopeptide repeat protein [Pseudomonadota bacterium]
MLRPVTIAIALSLTAACSTLAPEPVVEHAVEAPLAEPEPGMERPIPADSVYPLLVAEFALRRRAYDVALNNYLEQSEILREPAVSAHATHLAQFMQREDEALRAVRLWLELEPDNVEANNTIATLLARKGKTLEAVPHLAIVARSGKSVHFPILLTNFDKLPPGEQAKLVAGINELALEFPDETGIPLSQAIIHNEFKQNDQALEKLDKVFEQKPYHPQALVLEARILMERKAKNPLSRIEDALEAEPENSKLRLQYAQLLTRSSMATARQQFEILAAQSPGNGDILFSLALINRETGNTTEAKAYLEQMVEQDLRAGEAHYYLGRILEDEGELKAAVSHYMQVEDGRDFLSANSRIGTILLATQQGDKNHAYLNDLRRKYPERKEQLYGLEVEMLTRTDDLDGAMNVLNAALRDMPESTTLRYTRSMLGEQQNDLALMERDLREIIQQEPDNATALNALGYTLANRTERYAEAYTLISRALSLQPEEPAILDSMGWVLFRQGKYAKAVEYLSRAYAKFPDPEVAAHLGEVLWVSGDTSTAKAVLQGAAARDPDHEVLVKTMERLGIQQPALARP